MIEIDFTERQQRILQDLCLGVSLETIASRLGIRSATVEAHKAALYSKISADITFHYGANVKLNAAIVINWALQNGYYRVPTKDEYSLVLRGYEVFFKPKTVISPKGFVYLAYRESKKATKIGYSGEVHRRIKNLQYTLRENLTLLAMKPGTRSDEKALH